MAAQIKSKPGLLKAYNACSKEVREYFEHIPKLLDQFPMDVCLAYVFARLELGQNMALYCGVVKLHRADSESAKTAVAAHHMTRKEFREKYNTVFGDYPPKAAKEDLDRAEAVRDAVMHGKTTDEAKLRNAIAAVLLYAEEINKDLECKAGFCPFCPDLRGFKGAGQALDKSTTRWLLKGMGFTLG